MPAAAVTVALVKGPKAYTPEAMAAVENSFLRRSLEYKPSAKSLVALAREFGTLLSATARRFVQMRTWSCHVGFWAVNDEGGPEFTFGYASDRLMLTIPKGFVASKRSAVGRAAVAQQVVQGWSDVGFVSPTGDPHGDAYVQALPMRSGRIISVAVFERAPEHLVAEFDRSRAKAPKQAVFRFIPRK